MTFAIFFFKFFLFIWKILLSWSQKSEFEVSKLNPRFKKINLEGPKRDWKSHYYFSDFFKIEGYVLRPWTLISMTYSTRSSVWIKNYIWKKSHTKIPCLLFSIKILSSYLGGGGCSKMVAQRLKLKIRTKNLIVSRNWWISCNLCQIINICNSLFIQKHFEKSKS